MKITKLQTNEINQNGYHKNTLTRGKIGALFIFPNGYTTEDCLSCDGYVLKIEDYLKLYAVIGKDFNTGSESSDEFRIPDYNISGRFLQPGVNFGTKINAGLPNITGSFYNANNQDHMTTADGVFRSTKVHGNAGAAYGNYGSTTTFDASRSNALYGSSSTVQPPSQIIHVCIKYK